MIVFASLIILQSLGVIQKWAGLHRFKGGGAAPCTALALLSNTTVVTGGEDGRLTLLKVDEQQPLRIIGKFHPPTTPH